MINYIHKSGTTYTVLLDGSKSGEIRLNKEGQWQYFPKGRKTGGDPYPTFHACFNSLKEDHQ